MLVANINLFHTKCSIYITLCKFVVNISKNGRFDPFVLKIVGLYMPKIEVLSGQVNRIGF